MTDTNLCVQLDKTPDGLPTPDLFRCVHHPIQEPAEGEVLVRNHWLSLDPYMRGQISGRHLSGHVRPGDTMIGETLGEVILSRSPAFKAGDSVRGMLGWQRYATVPAAALSLLPETIRHPTHALSVLGMPGLTAFAGLMWQAQPQPGDTLVVAAATGAVGSAVVQLARLAGCRVIAIAGGADKCRYAVDALGADACIDRHQEAIPARLDELCPLGIDIYFDLVGGELLNQISQRLAVNARVILCGMIADYNRTTNTPPPGPSPALWIKARARVHGLVVYDYEPRRQEFIDYCTPLVDAGQLTVREQIVEGLEQAPAALIDLLEGRNFGKVLVKI